MSMSSFVEFWDKRRGQILARANGHCERCNAPHGMMIYRNPADLDDYVTMRADGELITQDGHVLNDYGFQYPEKGYIVRLSVIHLDGNQDNNSDDNLKALCQLCKRRATKPARRNARPPMVN